MESITNTSQKVNGLTIEDWLRAGVTRITPVGREFAADCSGLITRYGLTESTAELAAREQLAYWRQAYLRNPAETAAQFADYFEDVNVIPFNGELDPADAPDSVPACYGL